MLHFRCHIGHIPILIEIYRSPPVYMIIHSYEIHAKLMIDFILSRYSRASLDSFNRFIFLDIVAIPDGVVLGGWISASSFRWGTYRSLRPWRRSFSHMSITPSITRPRYIVFVSSTIIPELFIDMSSQWSASRVITVILFRLPESLSSSCLGFQSHYCHLASRVITVILFRLPESLPSSCLGFQSHYHHLV
ncbi:hypothetical protein AAG906_040560 [Vitis piasezkii]